MQIAKTIRYGSAPPVTLFAEAVDNATRYAEMCAQLGVEQEADD
jgi:hypothetical protein